MSYTQRWTEVVTPEGQPASRTLHEVIVDDAAEQAELQREMAKEAREAAATAAALKNIYFAPRGAVSLLPGASGLLTMPDESVLSVGALGEVYLDGRRLGAARVSKLIQLGTSIYGKGATDGKLYRWTGTGWVVITDFDTALLG